MADEMNWTKREEGHLLGIHNMADGGTLLVDSEIEPYELPVLNAVHPLQAAANPGQSRFDLSIDPIALIPNVPTNDTIYVDEVNGDDGTGQVSERTFPFRTIGAALTAAAGLFPSADNRIAVKIHPGSYTEAPLTIPPWVVVSAVSGPETVIVAAQQATQPLITARANTIIRDLAITGAIGVGGVGISLAEAGVASVLGCVVRNCETGAQCISAGGFFRLTDCAIERGSSGVIGGKLSNGGTFVYAQLVISGAPGDLLPIGVSTDGVGSLFVGTDIEIAFCSEGVRVENDATFGAAGGSMRNCDEAIHVTSTSGTLALSSVRILDSAAEDMLIESSSARVIMSGMLHEKPLNVAAGAKLFGTRLDDGMSTTTVEGDLRAGAPGRPGAAAFGGGGIHTVGMVALTNTNLEVGTWANITTDLASPSGSTREIFAGTGVDNCFYLGGDNIFQGFQAITTIAASGGAIELAYWDGAVWQPFTSWMTTEIDAGASLAKALVSVVGAHNTRYRVSGWAAKVLNGILKYWLRFRISSALGTIPELEQAQLHTSHTAHHEDGKIEYFGDAAQYVDVDMDLNKWFTGATAPNDGVTLFSGNVSRGRRGADFPHNITRETGIRWWLPPNVDTSRPMELRVRWMPNTTVVGNMTLVLYHVPVPDGSIIVGTLPNEVTDSKVQVSPGVIGQEMTLIYTISHPTLFAGIDSLAMNLRRSGAQAYNGTVQVTGVTLRYYPWKA